MWVLEMEMAPQVVGSTSRPGPQKRRLTVDEHTISPAGDPFTALSSRDDNHPHACMDGYVFIGVLVQDEESGEEVERVEALPCRRCAEETLKEFSRPSWPRHIFARFPRKLQRAENDEGGRCE
jgi:hypothetical protein